jgi:hypothetical protein
VIAFIQGVGYLSGMVEFIVQVPADDVGFPLYGKDVVFFRKISLGEL